MTIGQLSCVETDDMCNRICYAGRGCYRVNCKSASLSSPPGGIMSKKFHNRYPELDASSLQGHYWNHERFLKTA